MSRVLAVLIMAVGLVAVAFDSRADEKPAAAAEATAEQVTIVDITDSVPFDGLAPGELARIVAGTPSGGSISIAIDGPGRLDSVAVVKTVKNGKPMIGELKKEFLIRRKIVGSGPVKVKVTCKPPVGEPETTTYEFEWK